MQLDLSLRRLTSYLYLQEHVHGTVVEVGPLETRTAAWLRERGAKVEQCEDGRATGLPAGTADLVLALEVVPDLVEAVAAEAKRILKTDGLLVVGCESRDRPGAKSGITYYDLVDRLEGQFAAVTMIGLAPFAGATLVEYGVKEPDPILDGGLVEKGERVAWYLAVAGAQKISAGGYAVVQVPVAEVSTAQPLIAGPPPAPPPPAAVQKSVAPGKSPAPLAPKPTPQAAELAALLAEREKGVVELQDALIKHAQEMAKVRGELSERDAYITELELDGKQRERLRETTRAAEARAQTAESREQKARRDLAEAQGRLIATSHGLTAAPLPLAVAVQSGDVDAQVAQLVAENEKLRVKEADARADAWKAMKARSEAEAAAAEVREDTVRKLKDARKFASVELMRAMEEATRKAVSLKEELERTNRERKEMLAELAALKAQLAAPPPVADPPPLGEATAIETAPSNGLELQRVQDEAAAERERAARLLADVEAEAQRRAESVARHRQALKEREREVEALRHEVQERDAKLIWLENEHPPAAELERLEAELSQTRGRLGDIDQEIQKKEATAERAVAAAQHERARAERLVAEERRAVADRNEARARLAEAEARAAGLERELEQLQGAVQAERERAERAEHEVETRKERSKQLKRDLEEAERRLSAVDATGERLQAMEVALRGEVERLAAMEDALRRAAAEAE